MDRLPLYLSAPHPCSYLPDQISRHAFIDPRISLNAQQRDALAGLGFRRSGPSHYRPECGACEACESSRVDSAKFKPNRNQRRCLRQNSDLIASWAAPLDTPEKFDLYQRYLRHRHDDGGMDPDNHSGFCDFLCGDASSPTQHLLIRDSEGTLLAVCVADRMSSGYSAVYTFFDPKAEARSLGRYAVLRLIECCRASELPWLYLGYFVRNCAKMSYKSEYQPQQRLQQGRWVHVID